MRMGDLITKQCKVLVENKKQAIIYAVIFSLLPFVSWLSVTLVSLVTLRKGAKPGFDVLLPSLVVHSVPLMMLIPLSGALINTLIAYLPCYIAALVLRKTNAWQAVFGVFLIQAFVACLLSQLIVPDFIVTQFNQFKLIFMQYQGIVDSAMDNLSSVSLAQLFFGIQILSAIFSATISLSVARSMQAKLFLPGGFKQELLYFRSGRISLLVLIATALGTYYEIALAITILPTVLCYFLLSGFCLTYFIFAQKSQFKVLVILFLLILLKPTFVLFVYIIFGALDSLFNFRSYLPKRVRESI